MIVAGLHETYPMLNIWEVRWRDLINIYIPNMNKDTAIMNIARIRKTPANKLSDEEKKIKSQYKIRNNQDKASGNDFVAMLKKIGGGK